jgi:uncharacterized protein with HEPN domain
MKSDRKELHWLEDIMTAIEEIESHPRFPEGRVAFAEDKYFRGWCYLQIARISEACVHLADDFSYKDKHPDVLPWKDIRGERIILVHKYWTIDDDIIWDTVEKDLPMLKDRVRKWIEEKARP